MDPVFTIQYCLAQKEKRKIFEDCRVKIKVFWNDDCFHEKQFHYCLHCGRVLCRSAFWCHKQTFDLSPQQVREKVSDFYANQETHRQFLQRKFTTRFRNGRMVGRRQGDQTRSLTNPFVPIHRQEIENPAPAVHARRVVYLPVEEEPQVRDETDELVPEIEMDFFEEDEESINPQLLDCLSTEGFDVKQFKQFVRHFLRKVPETTDKKEDEKIQREKAEMVSVLAQNVYIMCTLTREQIKTITRFWKAMIAFIAPDAEETARRIHVSYSGCLRDAQTHYETKIETQRQMFQSCQAFSLSLDTSKYGRDTFLSCVGRFGFENRIYQEIILFEQVSEKSGRGLANYVYGKMNERGCDFSKLVSITTDGAKNMISQDCGLASELIKTVNEQKNTNLQLGNDVHAVWCIDHRLNLVAQDFQEVENINFVLMFIRWITGSDRLVSFTAFARTHQETKTKKIPSLSETRWLFIRDALAALLDQTETVEAFLNEGDNRRKWARYISTPQHPLGTIKDVPFSFKQPLVNAHFQFAWYVLDILGRINEIFQVKYGFVHDFLEYLVSLGEFLKVEIRKIEQHDFRTFRYLAEIDSEHIPQFVTILKRLFLNISVRFATICSSLDKKKVRRYLDFDQMIIHPCPAVSDHPRCGISPLLNVFYARQAPALNALPNPFFQDGFEGEWRRLIHQIHLNQGQIMMKNYERCAHLRSRERKVRIQLSTPYCFNLLDVFQVIPKHEFPIIWRFVVKFLTIMPTTVGCEQSFSYFRRTIHTNMSEETGMVFLFKRLELYGNDLKI